MKITAQLKSEVKRINQRYKDIVKELGANSQLAKTYTKYMNKISTSGYTKSGYLSIKTPNKLTEEDIKIINILSRLQTKGEYKKSKEKLFEELFKRKPKGKELKEFIDTLENIHDFIENNATFIYNVSSSLTDALHRSSNLTPSEFKEIQKLITIAKQTHFDVVESIKLLNYQEISGSSELYD